MRNDLSKLLTDVIEKKIETFNDDWCLVVDKKNASLDKYDENNNIFSFETEENKHVIHTHGFCELVIMISGTCPFNCEGEVRILKQGELCLIMPETPHYEHNDSDIDYLAIWVTIQSSFITLHISHNSGGVLKVSNIHQLRAEKSIYNGLISNISSESSVNGKYHTELAKTYILQILIYTLKEMEKAMSDGEIGVRALKIYHQILYYIDKQENYNISLQEISQHVGINTNHLNIIFKETMGITISQYVIEQKISRAKNMLLMDPEEKMSEIAKKLSFYDQYHFSKIFKKKTGLSPSEFRRTNSKQHY